MTIKVAESFENDLNKITDKKILKKVYALINSFEYISSIYHILNIKKMEGHKNYYRIRIGNYRIGIKIDKNIIYLIRFLHRKDIYKYFP